MGGKFWDKPWSLVDGCTKVSDGCDNCWLEGMHKRFEHGKGDWQGNVVFRSDRLDIPSRIKKPTVFAVWSDLYHEGVTDDGIAAAFFKMHSNPHHTYLIITKRIKRAVRFISDWMMGTVCNVSMAEFYNGRGFVFPDNIWHIVTMENQEMADERMPHLLQIPGKRGIIIEPMLGPVDINEIRGYWGGIGIDQVILGPENGPNKRPFKPEWAESVKAQCKAAGVPYYRKDKDEGVLAWR